MKGRSFVAPQGKSPHGYHDVYANIGAGVSNDLVFPPYLPILEPACNKTQYDGLMAALKQDLEAGAVSECASFCAGALCLCTFGCCSCPLCYICARQQSFETAMRNDIAKSTNSSAWGGGVRLYRANITYGAPESEDDHGVDHRGKTCTALLQGSHNRTYSGPVWPPAGYSVVISVPDPNGDFRARWLQMARGGVVQAQVVQAQVVGAPVQNVMEAP